MLGREMQKNPQENEGESKNFNKEETTIGNKYRWYQNKMDTENQL